MRAAARDIVPPSRDQDSQHADASGALPTDEATRLRNENSELKIVLGRAVARIEKLRSELEASRAQVAWFQRQMFGQKAERTPADLQAAWVAFVKDQEEKARGPSASQDVAADPTSLQLLLALVDNSTSDGAQTRSGSDATQPRAEPASPPAAPTPSSPAPSPPAPKGHGRRSLPETLRQESIVLEPEPGEISDGARLLGAEVSYRLGVRPAELVRIAVVRPRYAIDQDDGHTKVVTAEPPAEMIPHGLFAPSGLAHVLASKWDRHVPYNRIASFFEAGGDHLSASTLSGVGIRAVPLAKTLVDAMTDQAKAVAPYVAIDATGALLQRPGQCVRGHTWVRYVESVCVLISFTLTHDSETAGAQLDGWLAPVLGDGAAVYDRKLRETKSARGGCWSHGRRQLIYAAPMDGRALIGIKMINGLFAIERELVDATAEVRLNERQKRSSPIINDLFAWRDGLLSNASVPPRGPLGKALRYIRNQADRLTYFLKDGKIPIHNNMAELQLRHFCVGRKGWLFYGSENGAEAGSIWLTLALSARMHELRVEPYFRELFRVLPVWPKHRILELAPHRWGETRKRLVSNELEQEFGPITIPPPLAPPAS